MDFEDLRSFYGVATEGSFSKGAMRLHVAQSALSRRVARLEHVLGVRLLLRHGRGVRLTEEGVALVDRAKFLIDELEQIQRDVLSLSARPTGCVRLAMPPMTAQLLGPGLVRECRSRFPDVTLQLRDGFSDLIYEWVAEDKVDLGLLYDSGRDTDLRMLLLLDEPLYLLGPTEVAQTSPQVGDGPIDLKELETIPLILPSRPHSVRQVLDRAAARHGVSLKVVMEVDGIQTTKGLVSAGLGYSVFSNIVTRDSSGAQTLRAIPFKQKLNWQLALARKHMTRTPRAFTEVERLIKEQIHLLHAEGRWQGRRIDEPAR